MRRYFPVFHHDLPVCHFCQLFIMRDDDKGLSEFIPKVKEEFMQVFSIVRVEITR
jgi:hypothetical protein